MTQLLLIEDDAEMAREIVCEFHESGYVVEHADDGARGLALALAREYDAIVVDRMLPSLDGMSVLAQLRDCGRTTPVLILSAIGTVAERISGLRSGSDDYLVKPFVLGELVARVEALVRRPDRSTKHARGGRSPTRSLESNGRTRRPPARTPATRVSALDVSHAASGRGRDAKHVA